MNNIATKKFILTLLALGLLALTTPAMADWDLIGSGVDTGGSKYEDSVSTVYDSNGNPVVAYAEKTGGGTWDISVIVKKWDEAGQQWIQLGQTIGGSGNAAWESSLTVLNNVIYLAYVQRFAGEEIFKLYVKKYNSTNDQWEDVGNGNSLNFNTSKEARRPYIVRVGVLNTDFVVGWSEKQTSVDLRIYTRAFVNGNWSAILGGTYMNIETGLLADNVELFFDGSNLYATWEEEDNSDSNVFVKKYNAASAQWESVGGALNTQLYGWIPSIASDGTTPYVSFSQGLAGDATIFDLVIKKWNGSSWVQAGDILNEHYHEIVSYAAPSTIHYDNARHRFWVAFRERHGVPGSEEMHLYMKQFNGCVWVLDPASPFENALNELNGLEVLDPDIASQGSNLFVAFFENYQSVYAKKRISGTLGNCTEQ